MGFKRRRRYPLGGTNKTWKIIAALCLSAFIGAGISAAGDTASLPADNLAITGSVSNVLPQAPAANPAGSGVAPMAAPPAAGEESWLSGLHISGYGSQTFGMWQNPTTLRQYTRSRNNLAVARSLLQIDENYRLNDNNTFF